MSHKNSLFGASFEQSRRIVKKTILSEDGAQVGNASSMKFSSRLTGLLSLPLAFIMYGVGVFLPDSLRESTQGIQLISESMGQMIGVVGGFLRPVIRCSVFLFIATCLLNILPKINYAYQLLFGNLVLLLFILSTQFALLPMTAGMALGAFGWVGFGLQVLACLYLWKVLVLETLDDLKKQLYHDAPPSKDWGVAIQTFLKTYGPILLGLSILNRWTFNFGELAKGRPGLFSFLFGWLFILFMAVMLFAWGQILKNAVIACYFFKYRKEYRQHFKITDEQWYGKLRATLKKMMT